MTKQIKVEDNNNPYNLEIGKQYWFQYTGCKSEWFSGVVTRFTQFGHPWVEASAGFVHNGIISPGLYNTQEIPPAVKNEEKMISMSKVLEAFKHVGVLKINGLFVEEWFETNVK